MQDTLLIELLTEELPPKSLEKLSCAFADALTSDLRQGSFLGTNSTTVSLATPRRLAVLVTEVADQAPDSEILVKGPSVKAGLDAGGKPTPALSGFAKKRGVPVSALERVSDGKQEVFAHRDFAKGGHLDTNLDLKVEAALKKLPIPKVMRWGSNDFQFVRPVHGLVMMHGKRVVPGTILGLESRPFTFGHRFLSSGRIGIPAADQYEAVLERQGSVIASFAHRKELIRAALEASAAGAKPLWDETLLDEVTALVEFPVVYQGSFSADFLRVPQECLILSMQQHQKYFPLADPGGKLLPRFLLVANLQADDPANIIHGNERVLRARLADARFFYDQDRKTRLETRVPKLANVVYHNKLGSQYGRVLRVKTIANRIAELLGTDKALAERAAYLAKADLITDMVGEFPELQGIMGMYYALNDGESNEIATAIEGHYHPRFAGDSIPTGQLSQTVALADKFEALVGIFGVSQIPTGDKDPFALRRAALGIVRILIEGKLPLQIEKLIEISLATFTDEELLKKSMEPLEKLGQFTGYGIPVLDQAAISEIYSFIVERLRGYLREAGYTVNEIESVLCMRPVRLRQVPLQLAAVRAFASLPEAESLAAANKRVANILKQAAAKGESFIEAQVAALREPAEYKLFEALKAASKQATPLFEQGDYTGYLKTFAILKSPVDAFFDAVMVMADDAALRQNRLALLADLRREMNRVADISKLAS